MFSKFVRCAATMSVVAGLAVPAFAALPSLAPVVEMVQRAVVAIEVERAALPISDEEPRAFPWKGPFDPEWFFRREFEGFLPQSPGSPDRPNDRYATQGGAGFFIDAEGHLVTNAHLVGNGRNIRVHTADGKAVDATLVGQDVQTDLALLKVDLDQPSPFVSFADSDAVRVGDWVFAIGSPYGFQGTVTTGIVSAHGRDIGVGRYDDFLQIDAPINRGNSGGPTFDLEGRVVGVNTAIYSPTGGSIGIGFAVPSNTVRAIVADLQDDGKVERGWLGVQIQPIDDDLAEALGFGEPRGALITDVAEGSPAAAAGLKTGSVVTAINDLPIEDVRDLGRIVAATAPGTEVSIAIWRDRGEAQVKVRVGRWPDAEVASSQIPARPDFGLQLGQDSGVGALVEHVAPGSPAARKHMLPGDRILKVDGAEVTDAKDASNRLTEAWQSEQSLVVLEIERGHQTRFVALRLQHA